MSKKILNTIPLAQSSALAMDNYLKVSKKMTAKDMVGQGVKNIVGVSLIGTTADIIDSI